MGVKRAEGNAPISAAPSKIQVAEKEKKLPRSEESCGKIFTGEKICVILIQDQERRSPVRRLSAHRNGLPHRQDAGLPRGGHDPGDGARDAAERPMDKLHRAASLSAWKKAPLPKKAAVLAFLRYVNYNETDY